ncbi:thyroid receptor-interacting protein 11 isoform X2 [Mangifera indica]|nr:thyroid receptor-interacting protein 11 isoform X2 [Mangifera indica]
MLLRRWLIVLKEAERSSRSVSEDKENVREPQGTDEGKDSARKSAVLLYYDSDVGGEPLNFRDVFLQSQALEGITLSMILEAPSDEEISLLLEMFGLCLTGGKEVHNAITSSIQDLATVLSSYEEEVLVKREELLQFVQGAISGLKINADIIRINAEAFNLRKKLDGLNASLKPSNEGLEQAYEETTMATIESLKEALAQVRACSRLEGLLLKKKMLNSGDSPEIHAQKVEKLKVLSESLANSTIKAEKRISDHRLQKEEALKVRVVKSNEANEKEKELAAEIAELEKERDHLEAELKKVNITLAAAHARLRNAKEEREQFDEANHQIVEHLKTKEDELFKSIAACRVEADVLNTWINFLEDTWVLQCNYAEIKDKQVNDELDKHEDYFVKLAISLLSDYKKELGPSVVRIGKFVENLKNLREGSEKESRADNEDPKELNPRKNLEEEYLNYEAKIITTFSVVDNMKEQFYAPQGTNSRKDDVTVKELFDDIEKLRQEFESIERPNLELETPASKANAPADAPADTPSNEKPLGNPFNTPAQETATVKPKINERTEKSANKAEQVLDPEAELAKFESEFGKVGQDYTGEEIGDWEFDELEKELKSEGSAANK